ncbi:hypothetical protein, partial [Brevundimonas sp.]|uniref:hypothetical protein n=1 Tax=Brevundimonas sp. TaxID=1871086 RepID=UPI002ED88E82
GGGGGGQIGPHCAAAVPPTAVTTTKVATAGVQFMIRTRMGRPPDEIFRGPCKTRAAPACI